MNRKIWSASDGIAILDWDGFCRFSTCIYVLLAIYSITKLTIARYR